MGLSDNHKCPRSPFCERREGHVGDCSRWLVIVDAAKKQGDRLANWAAQKVLDLCGYRGPR
jgi:hypothetical protein